jgi:hypothetical protein
VSRLSRVAAGYAVIDAGGDHVYTAWRDTAAGGNWFAFRGVLTADECNAGDHVAWGATRAEAVNGAERDAAVQAGSGSARPQPGDDGYRQVLGIVTDLAVNASANQAARSVLRQTRATLPEEEYSRRVHARLEEAADIHASLSDAANLTDELQAADDITGSQAARLRQIAGSARISLSAGPAASAGTVRQTPRAGGSLRRAKTRAADDHRSRTR